MRVSKIIAKILKKDTEAERLERRKQGIDAQLRMSDKELEEMLSSSELEHQAEISERAAILNRSNQRERKNSESSKSIAKLSLSLQEITEQTRATRQNRIECFQAFSSVSSAAPPPPSGTLASSASTRPKRNSSPARHRHSLASTSSTWLPELDGWNRN
jgi:chromosome condensin MukBEF ATPase and DNA-binding subunit MukB